MFLRVRPCQSIIFGLISFYISLRVSKKSQFFLFSSISCFALTIYWIVWILRTKIQLSILYFSFLQFTFTKQFRFQHTEKNEHFPNKSKTSQNIGHWTNTVDTNVYNQCEIGVGFFLSCPRHYLMCNISGSFSQYCYGMHPMFLFNFFAAFMWARFCGHRFAKRTIVQPHWEYWEAHQQ